MLYPAMPSPKMLIVTGIPMAGLAKSVLESKNAAIIPEKINKNIAIIIGSENVSPME